jgi:hypothetical protein|tara:strand:+ start:214 stop:549 length:336 start_codon:yes stop_codon:yes gene_type:complete
MKYPTNKAQRLEAMMCESPEPAAQILIEVKVTSIREHKLHTDQECITFDGPWAANAAHSWLDNKKCVSEYEIVAYQIFTQSQSGHVDQINYFELCWEIRYAKEAQLQRVAA